jgi:hypothetical protein
VTQFFTGTLLTFTGTAFRPVPASLHHWLHGLKVQDRQVTNLCLDVTRFVLQHSVQEKRIGLMRVGYIGTR